MAEIPSECPHKAIVEKYLVDIATNVREGNGLLLWGEYSTGKSALASIILKCACSHGMIGMFVRAGNLAEHIIEKTRFDGTWLMRDRALEVPLLVVDEVILRGKDQFRETVVEDLIRERTNRMAATVVTTNLSPTKISDVYPALAAVMKEAMLPVKVSGHDFRADLGADLEKDMT